VVLRRRGLWTLVAVFAVFAVVALAAALVGWVPPWMEPGGDPVAGSAANRTVTAEPPDPPAGGCVGARAFKVDGCTVATRSGSYAGEAGDRSSLYQRGCITQEPAYELVRCELTEHGDVRMALVGNSKASQWADALATSAAGRGWQISTYVASGCPPNAFRSTIGFFASRAAACQRWGREVQQDLLERGVDYVVFSASAAVFRNEEHPGRGFAAWLKPLVDAGVGVVVVRSTNDPTVSLPEGTSVVGCLRENRDDYRRCAGDRGQVVEPDPVVDGARSLGSPLVRTVGMTEFQCTDTSCPLVIGGVLAYYDAAHMTPTYTQTAVPWFRAKIVAAVRELAQERRGA
jgi:hypothetical protein